MDVHFALFGSGMLCTELHTEPEYNYFLMTSEITWQGLLLPSILKRAAAIRCRKKDWGRDDQTTFSICTSFGGLASGRDGNTGWVECVTFYVLDVARCVFVDQILHQCLSRFVTAGQRLRRIRRKDTRVHFYFVLYCATLLLGRHTNLVCLKLNSIVFSCLQLACHSLGGGGKLAGPTQIPSLLKAEARDVRTVVSQTGAQQNQMVVWP